MLSGHRFRWLPIGLGVWAVAVLLRLVQVQVVEHDRWEYEAQRQREKTADVRLASELAASGLRFRDVVLESAVPTSNSGLSYLATRATSAKNAFLVGVDTTVVDDSVVGGRAKPYFIYENIERRAAAHE